MSRRDRGRSLGGMLAAFVLASASAEAGEGLRMSKPVVCRAVRGYADFEELPGASLTSDDKLMIYAEPTGFAVEATATGVRARLAVDGRVRRKGGKEAIFKKEPMFEYESKFPAEPFVVFLRADLAIKGLTPGDYELDLTLRDLLAKPPGATATRTVAFRVVPAGPADGAGKSR